MRQFPLIGGPFASQFERDGDRFLYRRDGRGAPLPLSAGEYDGFVRGYGWSIALVTVGFMGAVIGASMILAALFPAAGDKGGPIAMMLVIGGLLWLAVRRAMHAPARALAGRAPVGPERSKAEIVRPHMARLSYGKILATGGWLAFAAVIGAHESRPAALVTFGLAVLIVVIGSIRKWRWDRTERRGQA